MASVGNIWVNLKANTTQATSQISKAFNSMGAMALKFGATLAAMNFLKGSIDSANTLNEQMNALNVQFGKASDQILEFGKNSADAFGLSTTEAATYANEFSGLLSKIGKGDDETIGMIIELEKRIADLGSFKQRSFQEIANGLQSALAGRQSLTLQQMGIFLNQADLQAQLAAGSFEEFGFSAETAFQTLDQGTQIFLRLISFMQQSEAATGDFSNTLDSSFENQQKKLKANLEEIQVELGQKLLPMLIDLFSWLNDHINQVITALGILGGMFIGFKLGKFVGEMITAIGLLMGVAAAKTAAQTGIGALAAVPMVVGGVGAIIGGILGGVGLSGAFKSSSSSSNPKEPEITISVDPISGRVDTNGMSSNVMSNYGRGGS